MWESVSRKHRRLQARAYPGIARVISNHAHTYHEDWTRRHLYSMHTDVRLAYRVVTMVAWFTVEETTRKLLLPSSFRGKWFITYHRLRQLIGERNDKCWKCSEKVWPRLPQLPAFDGLGPHHRGISLNLWTQGIGIFLVLLYMHVCTSIAL